MSRIIPCLHITQKAVYKACHQNKIYLNVKTTLKYVYSMPTIFLLKSFTESLKKKKKDLNPRYKTKTCNNRNASHLHEADDYMQISTTLFLTITLRGVILGGSHNTGTYYMYLPSLHGLL